MKKILLGFSLALVFMTPVFAQVKPTQEAVKSTSSDVVTRAKGFVSDLIALGKISKGGTALDLSPEGKKLVESLSTGVDFEALARSALGSKWDALKPAVKNDFMSTLRETIETVLYPRAHRISAPLNEIQFTKNSSKPMNVLAKTKFEAEKEGEIVERDLEFELIFGTGGKKIVDAWIEGELVSANLKRQFDQALQKKTMEQILEQMKKRLSKVQAGPSSAKKKEKASGEDSK